MGRGGVGGQGSAQVAPHRRRADPRARARRGLPRGDGELDQLQHGVDVDLRAAADVRVPRPPRPRESMWGARHAQDYHVVGSDASGVVLRVGSAVRNWKPGDRVTVHCNHLDDQDPSAHDDSMLAANQRIWGFETNFGGLADLSIVKANQLMPKPEPPHLGGGGGQRTVRLDQLPDARRSARRPHEAGRQRVHLGRHRRHRRLRHPARAQRRRHAGRRRVEREPGQAAPTPWAASTSSTAGPRATSSGPTSTPRTRRSGAASGKKVRSLVGEDPDIVFEHPGRQTMGASVFIAKRGGTIVTCAATSGYMIEYDNRHLWMKLKRIVSSHFANYQEAWEMNRLIDRGAIQPVMSAVYPLEQRGRGRPDGPPQRGRGQARRAVPGARGRPRASPTPRSGSASARTRSPCSSATPAASCRGCAVRRRPMAFRCGPHGEAVRSGPPNGCERQGPGRTSRVGGRATGG